MNTSRSFVARLAVLAALLLVSSAATHLRATEIIPPNDFVGQISANDGSYSTGRGLLFQLSADTTFSSIGIYLDLPNPTTLSYYIAADHIEGISIIDDTILSSGSQVVSGDGFTWFNFEIDRLTLGSGQQFHLEFVHDSTAGLNFFYNNQNVPWQQGTLFGLDGAQTWNWNNRAVAAFQLTASPEIPASVPLPVPVPSVPDSLSTLSVLGVFFLALAALRRRRTERPSGV